MTNDSFDISKLRWMKGESEYFGTMRINHATAQHSFQNLQCAIGVDPGRRWGMAFVLENIHPTFGSVGFTLSTYWGIVPKEEHTQDYFHAIRDFVKLWLPPKCPARIVMIEGASYADRYGQAMLEQCRLGFYEAFRELCYLVEYVPPMTPRKAVFGNGRTAAKNIWLDIDGNASDASCLALYGGNYKYTPDK